MYIVVLISGRVILLTCKTAAVRNNPKQIACNVCIKGMNQGFVAKAISINRRKYAKIPDIIAGHAPPTLSIIHVAAKKNAPEASAAAAIFTA